MRILLKFVKKQQKINKNSQKVLKHQHECKKGIIISQIRNKFQL